MGIWYSLEVVVLLWIFRLDAGGVIALVDVASVSILSPGSLDIYIYIYTEADLAGYDFWSVLTAHLLLWPAFSVFKYVVLPAKKRSLVCA